MCDLFKADCYRMFHKKWFWLCVLFMTAMSGVFVAIQKTAMDYTVSVDRVLFLPMSFYGVAAAALVSLFLGEDFNDGFMKNKIIAGKSRRAIYFSSLFVSGLGCMAVYLLMLTVTVVLGMNLFEVNISIGQLMEYTVLGLFTCVAYNCLYGMISMLNGNKTVSVVICMTLSFAMLFLCLHTNQILMQQEFKDGVLNLSYVSGLKRTVYEFLHDFNPSGQAAQLSSMQCLNAVRYIAVDILWCAISFILGAEIFKRKDIYN